eukprot:g32220.t1
MSPDFLGEGLSVTDASTWRHRYAHDLAFVGLDHRNLASIVCDEDGALIFSTAQVAQLVEINNYLGLEKLSFELPNFQPGMLLAFLCILLWNICIFSELRSVYLASPLKFSTHLHAFSRVVPKYYINPWEKNPYKFQHHKLHGTRARKYGKFGVWDNFCVGSCQSLPLFSSQDFAFWEQVAERTVSLRDIMDCEELIDDVDKLSLVEAAVILNAYAQFNCESKLMLKAFAEHVVRLLSGQSYTSTEPDERYGSQAADPQTLAASWWRAERRPVLSKAVATLKYQDAEMMRAVRSALIDRIEDPRPAGRGDVFRHAARRSYKPSMEVKFDAITQRLRPLCEGLDANYVDPVPVTQKVIEGFYNGIATAEIDTLAAETCAYMSQKHPDFSILAARIAVSNLHKNTSDSFYETLSCP